ncbi:hypothetical protein H6G04_34810 [Calothrix membranacea FACHB-236]|nr:hypothetical protein [Calothrix membranacea FACHB-236]
MAPEEINPAVQMCYQMRQRQVITGIDWENAGQLSIQIEEAIASGTKFSQSLNQTLKSLKASIPTSSVISEGF